MVRLVAIAQSLEDLDRIRQVRFRDLDRLEAAFEGRVLLDVLAVLIKGRRADRLQLTAGEHRLEDRGGVDRALGSASADERVDLVDEQDDVAAGADLLEHLLQPFLEVTAVAGAGDERAEVERVELLVLEDLGHVAAHDRLGQALDDGGLADAGLADEDRVVLRAAREHLHDALHLLGTADDRVELALAGGSGEVPAELVEHERAGGGSLFTAAAGRTDRLLALVAGDELDDFLAHARQVGSEFDEHLGGDAFAFADEAEQDVLSADVGVAQLQRFAQAELQDLLGPWGKGDVAAGSLLTLADDLSDLVAHLLE